MKFIRSQSIATQRTTKRSMQYYRIWIYSCNGVLGVTSAIFAIAAAFVVADVRFSLLGGVELYHPTFLYAYVALLLQCGVVQTIGCLGATRLSHKWLSVYWILLLLLTIGDVVVGLVWIFKLDKVKLNLRPTLTREFFSKYSTDEAFTKTWNIIQAEEQCCGVDGPNDYIQLSQIQSRQVNTPGLIIDAESGLLSLPESCCIVIYDSAVFSGSSSVSDDLDKTHRSPHHSFEKEFPISSNESANDHGGGERRDWDGRSDNVTNPLVPSGGQTARVSSSHINYDDSLPINDAPMTEFTEVFSDQTALQDKFPVISSDDDAKHMPININNPSLVKHIKMRHGNHRWKLQPHPQENIASNQSFSNFTTNDTLVELSTLSNHENQSESRNKTKTKPKTQKLFPSFSHPNSKQSVTTADSGDTTTKMSIPFTCQKFIKVRSKQLHGDIHHNTNHNNNNNNKNQLENERRLNSETTKTNPSSYSSIESKSSPSNEIRDGDEENIDEHLQPDSFTQGIFSEDQKFLTSNTRHDKNRQKRNNPVITFDTDSPSKFEPIAGSHLFSFLHAPAFNNPPDEDNGNSREEKSKKRGQKVNEMQAAYYFSSARYQTNSLNGSLVKKFQVYRNGCGVKLIQWVDHVAGILFILGICIILFVKLCFLVILHTEIGEMIAKIQILNLDPASPSRSQTKDPRLHHVSHPLLTHAHRASTVSSHAYNAALPTIKSPEGPTGPIRFPKSYHQRRHSNIIGDRSSTHSQETVNMTLLVTSNGNQGGSGASVNENKSEKGRSNPNLSFCGVSSSFLQGRDDFDPLGLSLCMPNTTKYLRRSSTCSVTAHGGGAGYSSIFSYDDPRPGPSSRFYHHDTPHHHNAYHQHCFHGHHPARPKLYARNMSIGAVTVHQTGATSSTAAAFRNFRRGDSGSGNCSFSSRDENEVLATSTENVVIEQPTTEKQSDQEQLIDAKEKEEEEQQREAEIREWAASTARTDEDSKSADKSLTPAAMSLGEYTKDGFNHDSGEAGDGRRNGNNNVDFDSIPLAYLGTAV